MKTYNSFIAESARTGGIPTVNKELKKRFKGTTDTKRKSKMKGPLAAGNIGGVNIPKVKGSDVQKFLQSLGFTTQEVFDDFIDMWKKDNKGITYKATIVSKDNGVEVRLVTHRKGKSSKIFRQDTFDSSQATRDSKFKARSNRYK